MTHLDLTRMCAAALAGPGQQGLASLSGCRCKLGGLGAAVRTLRMLLGLLGWCKGMLALDSGHFLAYICRGESDGIRT